MPGNRAAPGKTVYQFFCNLHYYLRGEIARCFVQIMLLIWDFNYYIVQFSQLIGRIWRGGNVVMLFPGWAGESVY